jgi:hypothetical protein
MKGSLPCLSYDALSLIAIVLMPAELCDSESCDAFRAMCGSCRALRAFFVETRGAFSGTYVVSDSPAVCASAHRAGLVFDPGALSARIARDFALFPRMRSLILSTETVVSREYMIDASSAEMYTSLPLRCTVLESSWRWTGRVTEMRIHGSWLGTCAELASFKALRSLALVECRCHNVAGLDELDLESLTIDALNFYAGRCGGRFVGPVTNVGREFLAPIFRARKLFVKRVPALATMFALL